MFYFPQKGEVSHFPSNLSEQGDKVKAQASFHTLKVVEKRTVLKKESFRDVMMGGNEQEILEFLEKENIVTNDKQFSISDIMFMLKKKDFFLKAVDIFRKRRYYNSQVWNWAFEHNDVQAMRERIQEYVILSREVYGYSLKTSLISLNKGASNYRHLDYYPLVNARAHSIGQGKEYWALNVNFRKTYDTFLQVLFDQGTIKDADKMQLV